MLLATATPTTASLLVRAGAAVSLPGVRRVQRLALGRAALDDLRGREHVVVPEFPLGPDRTVDLVVARFTPFAPGARAEIMEAGGRRTLALPDDVYFTGTVAGAADARVLLVAARTHVHGFVAMAGEVYAFGPDARGRGHRSYALRDVDPSVYPPPKDFCANDLEPAAVRLPEVGSVVAEAPAPAGFVKQADIAIETDQELRAKFASDQAALDYLATLAAAATTIYERDVAVRLRFSYIRLWAASPADPWNATGTGTALGEVRDYWNNAANNMAQIAGPRTAVHFISGKAVSGGVAYVNVLCNASYGYGVSQVYGSFDLAQPSRIWDVLVLTHELGHNFGSPHTHCYSPPLDGCYNQESGCYAGAVVASRGTIMSYCHLLAGGLSNIDLVFGSTVSARVGQSVAAAGCLADVPVSSTSTTTSTSTTRTTTSTTATTTTATTTTGASTTTTPGSSTTTQPATSTTVATTSTTTTTRRSTTTTGSSTTTRPPTTTRASTTSTTTSTAAATSSTTITSSSVTTTTLDRRGDLDGDGIADLGDTCPGTPGGDLVDPAGCSVCPCAGPRTGGGWASEAAYLRCVRAEVRRRVATGLVDLVARRRVVRAARHATCGRDFLTRCCLYSAPDDPSGRCVLAQPSACAARRASGGALDAGPGSCLPSPCAAAGVRR